METLAGKVFVLVGAASEEGKAVAKAFAKYSAKLSLCDSSKEKEVLDVLAKDCKEIGSNKTEVLTIEMVELHGETAMQNAVKQTTENYGSLDGLIYLVNQRLDKTFAETSLDDLNQLHVAHVESPLLWVQNSLPHLKASKGNIVLLSSGKPRSAGLESFPFALTKATEEHLVRTMALDLAAYGIRVNALCPSYPVDQTAEAEEERLSIRRSLSEYVAYLSSESATFITGQCINVGQS